MTGVLCSALLLVASVPVIMAAGARYAAWLERRYQEAAPRDDHPVAEIAEIAEIAGVAVVGDELLVHLLLVDRARAPGAAYWLQARPDAAAVEATDRCWAEHRLIRFGRSGPDDLLLDVQGTMVPMLRLADRVEPSV